MKLPLTLFLTAALLLPLLAACSPADAPAPPVTAAASDSDSAEDAASAESAQIPETEAARPETIPIPQWSVTPAPAADPAVTRPLRENVLTADADSEVYAILDVDRVSGKLARVLTDAHTKLHDKAFAWSYRNMPTLSFVPETPDLSRFEGFADESAVGQTFVLNFNSENKASEGSDYYSTGTVKIAEAGWSYYSWRLDRMSVSRSPLGWDQIENMAVTSTGWGQSNSLDTVLYLDNIQLYTNMDAVNPLAEIPQLRGAAAFLLGGSRAVVDQKLVKISARDDRSVPFTEDGTLWLPLAPLAAVRTEDAEYNAAEGVLRMTFGGKKYVYTAQKDAAEIDGHTTPLGFTVALRGDSLFVPAGHLAALFGFTETYTDEMGTVILSDKDDLFDLQKNLSTLFCIAREMVFVRPDAETVLRDMQTHLGGDVHPRVMASADDFARLASAYRTDSRFKALTDRLVRSMGTASSEFAAAPLTYTITANRLLNVSNAALSRIGAWSLLYRITGEKRYAERAIREMEAVCAFPDWHPDHFLDTGVMCAAVATGYDWLYDELSGETRGRIERALYEKGMLPGLDVYEGRRGIWGDNNWSGVCNGGLTAAAVAVAGVYPEDASRLISFALAGVEASMLSYAPDGGYVESPGYWSFGTQYMQYMVASLDAACGRDYGVFSSPGFAASAYFAAYFETEDCSWNFNDGSRNRIDTSCITWFARRTGDPDLRCLRYTQVERGIKPVTFFDVLWYDPDISPSLTMPLDAHFLNVGAVTMRNTWEDDATFVGFGGGSNSVAHGDLDIGNFVIDGDGYRFLDDLGSDSYELPQYFNALRWNYYRKRAEGQNTLVIGDVSYRVPDQVPTATGVFTRVESAEDAALAVLDMTTAYTQMERGTRGILFRDGRSNVIVQDEVHLKTPEIIRWQVHTRGKITVSEDGRTAMIRDGGHAMYIEMVTDDASLRFSVRDANSYDPNYKNAAGEYARSNLTKLCVITPDKRTDFSLAVVFRVLHGKEEAPPVGTLYTWQPIAAWTLE